MHIEKVGKIEIGIAPLTDDAVESVKGQGLKYTSGKKKAPSLRQVLSAIAVDLSDKTEELGNTFKDSNLNQLTVNFRIGFHEKANVWVMGFEADQGFEVEMVWAKKDV